MGKLNYKVGDKVRIKSLDWYNENKDEYGNVNCSLYVFSATMRQYCDTIRTIRSVDNFDKKYKMVEDGCHFDWTDEMIEGLVEEETKPEPKFKVGEIVYSTTWQRDVIILDILPNGFYKVGDIHLGWFRTNESALRKEKITLPTDSQFKKPFKQEISLPEGYQFVDENNNVINATKIVLEKKEYPKTYEECCRVLEIRSLGNGTDGYKWEILSTFQNLIIYRNAYWKIAGDEMGLGKPWEPDWTANDNHFYTIHTFNGKIECSATAHRNAVLIFPTEEMRDAFYKNFDKDIEFCKELL